ASVEAPVALRDLARRGLDPDGLEQAGGWAFSSAWPDDLRARAHAALAAREAEPDPGLPATALVREVPWSAEGIPLLRLERVGGRLYLPGRRPAAAPAH